MSESSVKLARREGFAVLYNSLVRDPRLSLKTKGLMAVLVSLPPDWDYNVGGLARINNVGKDTIRGSLNELAAAGYLTREQVHNDSGQFSGNAYVIHERSTVPLGDGEGAPLSEKPTTDEPTTDEPTTDEPTTDEPAPGTPTQYSKDISSKDKYIPPVSPKRGMQLDALFEHFWASYPRKVNRDRAKRAWKKLKPDLILCGTMAAVLEAQKASEEWTHDGGKYIPHPATWLNGRRWEDEAVPTVSPPESPGQAAPCWGWHDE